MKNTAHDHEWLKYELRKRGYTLSQIAEENDVTRAAISRSLRHPSRRLGPVIAAIVGLPPEVIWPDKFCKP